MRRLWDVDYRAAAEHLFPLVSGVLDHAVVLGLHVDQGNTPVLVSSVLAVVHDVADFAGPARQWVVAADFVVSLELNVVDVAPEHVPSRRVEAEVPEEVRTPQVSEGTRVPGGGDGFGLVLLVEVLVALGHVLHHDDELELVARDAVEVDHISRQQATHGRSVQNDPFIAAVYQQPVGVVGGDRPVEVLGVVLDHDHVTVLTPDVAEWRGVCRARTLDPREEHEGRGGLVVVALDLLGVLADVEVVYQPVEGQRPDQTTQKDGDDPSSDDFECFSDHHDLLGAGRWEGANELYNVCVSKAIAKLAQLTVVMLVLSVLTNIA